MQGVHNIFQDAYFCKKRKDMSTAQELFDDYLNAIEKLKSIDNFYDYEEQFARLHQELGRQILEKSLEQDRSGKEYKKKRKPDLEK